MRVNVAVLLMAMILSASCTQHLTPPREGDKPPAILPSVVVSTPDSPPTMTPIATRAPSATPSPVQERPTIPLINTVSPTAGTPRPTSTLAATPTVTLQPLASRKVILIQGIDSSSSCEDLKNKSSTSTFAHRRKVVVDALAPYGAKPEDILGFSYSGQYATCGAPGNGAVLMPAYQPSDTCGGAERASARLKALIDSYITADRTVSFDMVAHSFGGLVTMFYLATSDTGFLREHVHSVVLLDSPVGGLPRGLLEANPFSACVHSDPTWQDMLDGSAVLKTIAGSACRNPSVHVAAVLATYIGDSLNCVSSRNADSFTEGSLRAAMVGAAVGAGFCSFFWGPLGVVACAILGSLASEHSMDTAPVHSTVWSDPVARGVVIELYRSK
jgi:pimeloyl-ACP methyl ester carboxylesterase